MEGSNLKDLLEILEGPSYRTPKGDFYNIADLQVAHNLPTRRSVYWRFEQGEWQRATGKVGSGGDFRQWYWLKTVERE